MKSASSSSKSSTAHSLRAGYKITLTGVNLVVMSCCYGDKFPQSEAAFWICISVALSFDIFHIPYSSVLTSCHMISQVCAEESTDTQVVKQKTQINVENRYSESLNGGFRFSASAKKD